MTNPLRLAALVVALHLPALTARADQSETFRASDRLTLRELRLKDAAREAVIIARERGVLLSTCLAKLATRTPTAAAELVRVDAPPAAHPGVSWGVVIGAAGGALVLGAVLGAALARSSSPGVVVTR